MRRVLFCSLAVVLAFAYCTRSPYAVTNRSYKKQAKEYAKLLRQYPVEDSFSTGKWVGTTNFNMRKPNFVIIHHTAQTSCEQTLRTFTLPRTQVSAHYVICEDGTIHHMLNDYLRAWHGGIARWGNNTDINSSSIGIEIDNDGKESFSEAQISSLITVLGHLKRAFGIPVGNFIGHADIAPTRKNDPNVSFPWKQLSEQGFGHWWNDTTGVVVPADFNALQALRIVGYDVRDTLAVYRTFRRKYVGEERSGALTESDRKILFSLYRKYE